MAISNLLIFDLWTDLLGSPSKIEAAWKKNDQGSTKVCCRIQLRPQEDPGNPGQESAQVCEAIPLHMTFMSGMG